MFKLAYKNTLDGLFLKWSRGKEADISEKDQIACLVYKVNESNKGSNDLFIGFHRDTETREWKRPMIKRI